MYNGDITKFLWGELGGQLFGRGASDGQIKIAIRFKSRLNRLTGFDLGFAHHWWGQYRLHGVGTYDSH